MPTHTPGPWICIHDRDKHFVEPVEETPRGDYVAYCSGQGDIGPEEAAANGDLIAAAPDLLSVCEMLVNEIEHFVDCGILPKTAKNHKKFIHATQVIAKARGK